MSATRPYLVPVRNPENGGVMEGRYVAKSEGAARAMAEADGFEVVGIIVEEVAKSSEKQGSNQSRDEDLASFLAGKVNWAKRAIEQPESSPQVLEVRVSTGRGWTTTIAFGVCFGLMLSAIMVPLFVIVVITALGGFDGFLGHRNMPSPPPPITQPAPRP